jgi:hypothetical protein
MFRLVLGIAIGNLWPLGFLTVAYFMFLAVREPLRPSIVFHRVPTRKAAKYLAIGFATFLAMLTLKALPSLIGVNPN